VQGGGRSARSAAGARRRADPVRYPAQTRRARPFRAKEEFGNIIVKTSPQGGVVHLADLVRGYKD